MKIDTLMVEVKSLDWRKLTLNITIYQLSSFSGFYRLSRLDAQIPIFNFFCIMVSPRKELSFEPLTEKINKVNLEKYDFEFEVSNHK